jgi:HEPN domain-containing protein
MSPKKEDLIEKVNHWVELAEEDLRVAKYSLTMSSNVPYRIIAFHAQQCAEKYIKALLVLNNLDFPYTHDLEKLLGIAPKQLNLLPRLAIAGELTDYAVSKRYPDYYQKLSKEEAIRAIEISETVKEYISNIFLNSGYNFVEN